MDYKIKPWKHQLEAIETGAQRDHLALFFEMGTGKTATAINILRKWNDQEGRQLNTLILCPPIVIDQWAEEFSRHSDIPSRLIVRLKGTGIKRLKLLQEGLSNDIPKIYITNYETVSMPKILFELKRHRFDALICDESHKLKNIKAKRTKVVTDLSDRSRKKLILTGSPVLNSPMDIFSQYRILDGGDTFGQNFFVFRAQYFYDANSGMPTQRHFPDWRPKENCNRDINASIYRSALRVKKDECLDLPPLVKQEINIDMAPDQKKAYKEMERDLITYLGDEASVATMAITKILRLQQIVSGFIKFDTGETKAFEKVPRLAALEELLTELTPEHKVIIWASFHDNYREVMNVASRLGIAGAQIHGLCSEKQKANAVKSFREDKDCRFILANPKSGGVGLNLSEASYSIYYSRGYSLEDDMQSEARNYRGGSEIHKKVTRIDLVTPGTIDKTILDVLKKKQKMSENILAIKKQLGLY